MIQFQIDKNSELNLSVYERASLDSRSICYPFPKPKDMTNPAVCLAGCLTPLTSQACGLPCTAITLFPLAQSEVTGRASCQSRSDSEKTHTFALTCCSACVSLRNIKRAFELDPAVLIAASGPDRFNRKHKINKKLFDYNSISPKVLDTSNFVTFWKSSVKYLITIDEQMQPSGYCFSFLSQIQRETMQSYCFSHDWIIKRYNQMHKIFWSSLMVGQNSPISSTQKVKNSLLWTEIL